MKPFVRVLSTSRNSPMAISGPPPRAAPNGITTHRTPRVARGEREQSGSRCRREHRPLAAILVEDSVTRLGLHCTQHLSIVSTRRRTRSLAHHATFASDRARCLRFQLREDAWPRTRREMTAQPDNSSRDKESTPLAICLLARCRHEGVRLL